MLDLVFITTIYAITLLSRIHASETRACTKAEYETNLRGGLDGFFVDRLDRTFFISTTTKTWQAARMACQFLHADSDIVQFTFEDRNALIADRSMGALEDRHRNVGYWIGLRRRTDIVYYWRDNEEPMDTLWWGHFHNTMPDINQFKCVIKHGRDWKWSTVHCNSNRYFICGLDSAKYRKRFEIPKYMEVRPDLEIYPYGSSLEISCRVFTVDDSTMHMDVYSSLSKTPLRFSENYASDYKIPTIVDMRFAHEYMFTPVSVGALCGRRSDISVIVNVSEALEKMDFLCCLNDQCMELPKTIEIDYPAVAEETPQVKEEEGPETFKFQCEANIGSEDFVTMWICPKNATNVTNYWLINSTGAIVHRPEESMFSILQHSITCENGADKESTHCNGSEPGKEAKLTLSFSLVQVPAIAGARIFCLSLEEKTEYGCFTNRTPNVVVADASGTEPPVPWYEEHLHYIVAASISGLLILLVLISTVAMLCRKKKPAVKSDESISGEESFEETEYESSTYVTTTSTSKPKRYMFNKRGLVSMSPTTSFETSDFPSNLPTSSVATTKQQPGQSGKRPR